MTSPNFIYIIAGILVLYVLIFLALMRIRFFNKTRQRFFSYFLKPVNEISKGGATEVIKTFFIWRAIGLIILIALFIIIAGGFFAWQYFGTLEQIQPRPAEQTTKDETTGWKTYQNEQYGFEFQYPKDWKLFLNSDSINFLVLGNPIEGVQTYSINLEIRENLDLLKSEEYVEEENRDALVRDLTSLRQSLVSKAGIPKNTIKIHTVRSVIAMGNREIRNIEIHNSEEEPLAATATAY